LARAVIIDCDPGTDDAIALWLALASQELDVLAVTVVGGNVPLARTLPNALAVVALADRAEVPVYAGAATPLLGRFTKAARVHGADGLAGVALPPGKAAAPGIAADALRTQLRAATRPLTLIGIGPATNLALALATEPALCEKIEEVVLMSGAWGEGNFTPAAEFNAFSDPEALAIVLAAAPRVTLATLDLTGQALVTPERVAQLRAMGSGTCLSSACAILEALAPSPRFNGKPLHDPCAVAWLLWPELFTTREALAAVECGTGPGRGRTHIDRFGRCSADRAYRPVRLLETLDVETFFARLGERLAYLR
jgi:inosine-uridine nucleoside N-ribohydrolase